MFIYNVRNTHATWSVPLVCLCASCVPCACQCALSRFGPLVHDELNPGSSLQRVHRQYNKRYMPALGSRLIFMWMMLLALQEKTVGQNGAIVADSYMKRLGIVCPLDSNPGSSLQRVHCTAIKYNKGYIDYARSWEPMDLDADDVDC